MNDSITKYLNKSKSSLYVILSSLESNIEFLDNDLWKTYDEIEEKVDNIIDIYFEKYYLYTTNDYSKIDKYINFNNKINKKLKNILLAIIDYYESIDSGYIIKEKESSILYLTILIYISLILYEKDFNKIDNPKKCEKVINNIIDNFVRIRFKKEKDLVLLISNIKKIVIENNKFNDLINSLNKRESHNVYLNVNKHNNFYKVIYEYNIKDLNDYELRDINIVNNKLKISNLFTKMSYDICYYTMFKLMKRGLDYVLLLPIKKEDLLNEELRKYVLEKNELVNKNIKFFVDYEGIKNDFEFINLMNEKEMDIYVDVNKNFETDNYNLFMGLKNIVVTEEFLNINEKYIEIWKDMNMNFIIKNLGERLSEYSLISGK